MKNSGQPSVTTTFINSFVQSILCTEFLWIFWQKRLGALIIHIDNRIQITELFKEPKVDSLLWFSRADICQQAYRITTCV